MSGEKLESGDIYAKEIVPAEENREVDKGNSRVMSLPVSLTVSIGKVRLTMKELLALSPDAVLKLESTIEDPVHLTIGDRIVGVGELIEQDHDRIAVRLISLSEERNEDW